MFLALPLYALVMSARGHNRPSGDVGSMSGLPRWSQPIDATPS